MPDLFAPDPEHHAPAPQRAKPPAAAWVAGCKSGLLTVLAFFFLLAMTVIMFIGFVVVSHGVHQANVKIDKIQRQLDGMEKRGDDGKPGDKKMMPSAD